MGSGTVASLFALPLSLLAGSIGGVWAQVACLVAITIGSLVAVRPFASREGDPGWVVIDEAAGTFVATLGLGLPGALAGWAVFRAADIWKRAFPGVAPAERLPGSLGVTVDDLIAGLYGLAAGWAVQAIILR
jgi:phosphatidylglycerophosphatase A